MKLSLRNKFLLPTLLLLIIGMSVVTAVSYIMSRKALQESMINQIIQQAESTANFIDSWIEDHTLDVVNWGEQKIYQTAVKDSFVGKAARKPATSQLTTLQHDYPGYEDIHVVTTGGEVVVSSTPELVGATNVGSHPYFQNASNGNVTVSDVMKSDVTGNPVFMISAPIKENDAIIGVLVGIIDLNYINEQFLETNKVGKSGYAYMYTADGRVIAHPERSKILNENITSYEFGRHMLERGEGSLAYTWEGTEKLECFKKLRKMDWTIGLVALPEELFIPIKNIRNINFVMTILVLLLSIVITLFVVRSALKPIKHLAKTAEQLAQGDMDVAVRQVTSHDEIGALAMAFRTMQQTIGQVLHETNGLIQAIQEGRLDVRGNAEVFDGSWQDLVVGINSVLDAFVDPHQDHGHLYRSGLAR
jgi:methyl-accepting chemotaxis protein